MGGGGAKVRGRRQPPHKTVLRKTIIALVELILTESGGGGGGGGGLRQVLSPTTGRPVDLVQLDPCILPLWKGLVYMARHPAARPRLGRPLLIVFQVHGVLSKQT